MIGIVCAMESEALLLIENLKDKTVKKQSHIAFYFGKLHDYDVIVCVSGMGKVNASTATAILIAQYKCDFIMSTGIAGGSKEHLKIGDIVVASKTFEHDFDLSPLGYEKCFFPDLNMLFFELSINFTSFFDTYYKNDYHIGIVATGDKFINNTIFAKELSQNYGNIAFEMECAAIAHTCYIFGVQFFDIEVICDYADDNSHETITTTISDCCKKCQEVILKIFERRLV